MKIKIVGLMALVLLLIGGFTSEGIVKADDDDDDDRYEKRYKYEDDDDDEDDYYEYDYDEDDYDYDYYEEFEQSYSNMVAPNNTWNIWTRTTTVTKGALPFKETTLVQIIKENESISLYVIPMDGELFVPGKSIANLLGAKGTVFNTSKILEVTSSNAELVFRAETNIVYDSEMKTPIPSSAFYMNNDVYVPISVITNGLGYIAEWQEENQTLFLRPLS